MRILKPLTMIVLFVAMGAIGGAMAYLWIQLIIHFHDAVSTLHLLPQSSLPDCPNSKLIVDCLQKGGK